MQNFVMLRELGRTNKPVLLNGLSATLEEWLMSAEYILNEGNENVILWRRYKNFRNIHEIHWI